MKKITILSKLKDQYGSVAIIVGVVLFFVVLSIAAFVIDFGFRHVAQNQLANAADAGALAGARQLYYEDGSAVNAGQDTTLYPFSANQVAEEAAEANYADQKDIPVEVVANWAANSGDVQRGHWAFGLGTLARGFYPNDSILPTALAGVDEVTLDEDLLFINAVKVVTHRQATPTRTWFGKLFGFAGFVQKAEAVAYIGFAGTLFPDDVDQPIAICMQSILNDLDGDGVKDPNETVDCSTGRMLNSGRNQNTHNTGGWTNFDPTCGNAANPPDIRDIFNNCNTGNPDPIELGETISTTGGVQDNLIDHSNKPDLMGCWKTGVHDFDGDDIFDPIDGSDADDLPEYPWSVKLPVIDCPSNNVGPCSDVLGAITVNIVWINEKNNDIDADAPFRMFTVNETNGTLGPEWTNNDPNGITRWDDFVTTFNLHKPDGTLAVWDSDPQDTGFQKKSVYFLPFCGFTELAGTSGGINFGILSKVPVLVD